MGQLQSTPEEWLSHTDFAREATSNGSPDRLALTGTIPRMGTGARGDLKSAFERFGLGPNHTHCMLRASWFGRRLSGPITLTRGC